MTLLLWSELAMLKVVVDAVFHEDGAMPTADPLQPGLLFPRSNELSVELRYHKRF